MTNGRLVVDRVKLQKAGPDLISVIKLSQGNFYNNPWPSQYTAKFLTFQRPILGLLGKKEKKQNTK